MQNRLRNISYTNNKIVHVEIFHQNCHLSDKFRVPYNVQINTYRNKFIYRQLKEMKQGKTEKIQNNQKVIQLAENK